ncbi:hypothetical protein PLICRDRAFT_443300 [Plicaturopsis crispa FD-325 SS-3]|uniref:DUF6534 domain-containing protein n=1 Tax=Plicaturopsis crispa FD-325 SS-3 TaxID=944288 RepID=A0A0C9T6V1_PLICR|nr:hypothetical protein PLICRDRAFT_443300 [Plicaturopsis crispa FD-325 SS-3]
MTNISLELDGTLGVLVIGVLVSICLFGILTAQAFSYFRTFTNDCSGLRVFVAFVWTCDLAHTVTVSAGVYIMAVKDFGQTPKLVKPPFEANMSVVFTGIVAALVQSFFARRIWVLSQKIYITSICWFLCILRLVLSVLVAKGAFEMVDWTQYMEDWGGAIIALLVLSACIDFLVFGSLCYYLWRERAHAFKRTAKLLEKIVCWTIQTALLTSMASLTMLIVFITIRNSHAWLGIFMFLPQLFSNSLLASLNLRATVRRHFEDQREIPIALIDQSGCFLNDPNTGQAPSPKLPPMIFAPSDMRRITVI